MAMTPEQQDLVNLVRSAVKATDAEFMRFWKQVSAILTELGGDAMTIPQQRQAILDIDRALERFVGLTQASALKSDLFRTMTRQTDLAAELPYRRATATLKSAVEKKAPGFWERRLSPQADSQSSDPLLRTMAVLDGPIVEKQRMLRAGQLDPQRRWVPKERHNTDTGYRLSDRIWKGGQDVREAIDERIREGVRRGQSPLTIADDLEQFLNPDFASVVYGEDGSIIRRNETTVGGGKGNTYARRLARTEVSRIHGAATLESAKVVPGIVGIKWLLSNRHPKADECDTRAEDDSDNLGKGVYKLDNVPLFPSHTQCLCTLAHAHEDSDAFIDKLIAKYSAELQKRPSRIDAATLGINGTAHHPIVRPSGLPPAKVPRSARGIVAEDDLPVRPWESHQYRFMLPNDLTNRMGAKSSVVAYATTAVEHLRKDHSLDVGVLGYLQDLVDGTVYTSPIKPGSEQVTSRMVLYAQFDRIWMRTVIVISDSPDKANKVASIYRRDARKVQNELERGDIEKRGD